MKLYIKVYANHLCESLILIRQNTVFSFHLLSKESFLFSFSFLISLCIHSWIGSFISRYFPPHKEKETQLFRICLQFEHEFQKQQGTDSEWTPLVKVCFLLAPKSEIKIMTWMRRLSVYLCWLLDTKQTLTFFQQN